MLNEIADSATSESKSLSAVASQINDHHSAATRHAESALDHARQAGELLNQAKGLVAHGRWIEWLAGNCDVSPRQAQRYMKVASNWLAITKNDAASYLTDEGLPEEITPGKPGLIENSSGDEWYTPPNYLEAGRAVLGCIDLDPASNGEANERVKASRFFTAADDGLAHGWAGKVWLNPPYSTPLCGQFIEKLIDDHLTGDVTEALCLVNSSTDTVWFQMATRAAKAVCLLDRRVKFIRPGGDKGESPRYGQTVFYFGDDAGRFAEVFGKLGCVLGRIGGAQ